MREHTRDRQDAATRTVEDATGRVRRDRRTELSELTERAIRRARLAVALHLAAAAETHAAADRVAEVMR